MRHLWWLLVPVCVGLAAPAQARPRDEALSGAFRCAVIADSHQWLDCYYGAAQPMRAWLGLSPAPQAQPTAQPTAYPQPTPPAPPLWPTAAPTLAPAPSGPPAVPFARPRGKAPASAKRTLPRQHPLAALLALHPGRLLARLPQALDKLRESGISDYGEGISLVSADDEAADEARVVLARANSDDALKDADGDAGGAGAHAPAVLLQLPARSWARCVSLCRGSSLAVGGHAVGATTGNHSVREDVPIRASYG